MSSPDPSVMELAADFPGVDAARWQDLAAAVVNKSRREGQEVDGPGAQEALSSTLPGGVTIQPIYWSGDGPAELGLPGSMPFTRGLGPRDPDQAWDVRQLFDDPDPVTTRRAVLADLEHGVTSVWVQVGADGVAASDLGEVLADVMLDLAPVAVSSTEDQADASEALLAVLRGSEAPPTAIRGSLGHDPIGAAAATGDAPELSPLAVAVTALANLPGVAAITIDTRIHHDAGATDQDEIALAVATGVDYLRHLTVEGVDLDEAFSRIDFRIAVTADQFAGIAKLRALRRLWARVGEAAGATEGVRGARIHAVTSWRMQTATDPWVNVLRDTLACFAAAAGGADAVTVLPYDTAVGLPTPFARRLARNTQHLLASESHVGRVADPAGGSWYVESLTEDFAQQAWAWFQQVDASGGVAAGLADGSIAARLSAARAERDQALATRAAPLTGTSTFPLAGEQPIERATRPEVSRAGLPRRRDSEPFEELRARAAALPSTAVPVVAVGPLRDHTARLGFVVNLLAVAGLTPAVTLVPGLDALTELDEASSALAAAPAVILAGGTTGYRELAGPIVERLRQIDPAARIHVAGRARELDPEDGTAPEVDGEVREGMDVLAFLGDLLDGLADDLTTTTGGGE